MRFHIVSPGRNTGAFARDHFAGTLGQDFHGYAVTWIDDASDDGGDDVTADHARDVDLTIILNSKRKGGLANILSVVRAMQPDDVAVLCSADDSLAHSNVLRRVKQEYDAGALLTYGQFQTSVAGVGIASEPGFCRQMTKEEHANPYSAPWVTTHLITFRADLMQGIPDEFLRDVDGNYYDFAGDQAFMLFMLTQVKHEDAHFIPDVLLTYNRHAGNDDAGLAAAAEKRIRDRGRAYLAEVAKWADE
jgi:hypothetical protein